MSKTLTIVDDATARRIHKTGSSELKEILENSYGKEFFSEKITDRIKTFEDACEYNNTNSKDSRFIIGTKNQIYQERVAEITKALNEGWIPNYSDSSEYKYTPWFYLDNPSGFRVNDSRSTYTCSHAGGGSRFAFKTRELSDYAGKQFAKEYESWMQPTIEATDCVGIGSHGLSRLKFTGDVKVWESYIIPKISKWEDACSEIGENAYDPKFNEGTIDERAYKKMKVVCQALNGGWVCNWADSNQAKWYPWMEYNNAVAGFRFYDSSTTCTYSCVGSGSRLRLCSENIAKHFGTQFADLISQNIM